MPILYHSRGDPVNGSAEEIAHRGSDETDSVEARFTEDGTWLIDARLSWRDGPPPLGCRFLDLARVSLLDYVAREAERGQSLGATKVRVHMADHDGAATTPGEPKPEVERLESNSGAPARRPQSR